ncbi:unnamed protein product [Arctogadus glacialis]
MEPPITRRNGPPLRPERSVLFTGECLCPPLRAGGQPGESPPNRRLHTHSLLDPLHQSPSSTTTTTTATAADSQSHSPALSRCPTSPQEPGGTGEEDMNRVEEKEKTPA